MIRFSRFYVIELTFKCNTQCEYCYLRENRNDFFSKEMDFLTFKRVIDSIVANYLIENKEDVKIVLHGGEPLLLGFEKIKKFIEYMDFIFEKYSVNREVSLQTNGILLNEQMIDLLKSHNISIGLSYDGDNTSRIKDSETNKNILKTIKNMLDKKINFGIVSVIHKKNIDYFKTFEEEWEKYAGPESEYRTPKLIPLYDTTGDKSLKISLIDFFDKFEKERIDNFKAFDIYRGNLDIDRRAPKILTHILTDCEDNCRNTCNFKFCGSGLSICAVEPTGELSVCDRFNVEHFNKFRLKDVKDYDFLGVSQLKRALDFNFMLHDISKANDCDLCYARLTCNSDCQALHYSKHKSFGLDREICLYTKTTYDYIYDNLDKILKYLIENNKSIKVQELRVLDIKPRIKAYIKEKFKVNIIFDKINNILFFEKEENNV